MTDLDHPCKQTCSSWKQGYERGIAEMQAKLALAESDASIKHKYRADALERELADAREQTANLLRLVDTQTLADAVAALEVAKSESHQVMVALKPWIDGNPNRSHLDLAHFSACSFRAWGAIGHVLRSLKADAEKVDVQKDPDCTAEYHYYRADQVKGCSFKTLSAKDDKV